MSAKIMASLVDAIERWLEKNDSDLAVDVFFGDISEQMALAASAVYTAVVDAQRTAIRQNNLQEVE